MIYFRLALKAFFIVYRTLKEGEGKHGKDNWKKISIDEHLKHAFDHLVAEIRGKTDQPHGCNAITRLVMVEVLKNELDRARVRRIP